MSPLAVRGGGGQKEGLTNNSHMQGDSKRGIFGSPEWPESGLFEWVDTNLIGVPIFKNAQEIGYSTFLGLFKDAISFHAVYTLQFTVLLFNYTSIIMFLDKICLSTIVFHVLYH